jgi:hypothetical protein
MDLQHSSTTTSLKNIDALVSINKAVLLKTGQLFLFDQHGIMI